MEVKSGVDSIMRVYNSIHCAYSFVRNSFLDFLDAISKLKEMIAVNKLMEKKLPMNINTAKKKAKNMLAFLTGPLSSPSMNFQK